MAASPEEIRSQSAGKTNYVPRILIGCGTLLVLRLIVGALAGADTRS
jgi:hypothetical protein